MSRYQVDTHFVAGEMRASTAAPVVMLSPIDLQPLTSLRLADEELAELAIKAGLEALPAAEQTTPAQRANALRAFAAGLDARGDELAELAAREIGCPLAQAKALQVGSASGVLRAVAALVEEHRFEENRPAVRGGRVIIRKVPVGLAVGIVAWNVPMFLACEKLASAIAAGCPIILKPSPENARTMQIFGEVAMGLDLPSGMIAVLTGDRDIGRRLVADPRVSKVSFTGSTAAGRTVAEVAASRFARCTLELGGKSAAILLDDFKIEDRADELFLAMVQNNGQVCGAQSRVLVPRGKAQAIRDGLAAMFDSFKVGDPLDPSTQIGPLATRVQSEKVKLMFAEAIASGAQKVGGSHGKGSACLVDPALLLVEPDARIAQDEVFGPLTALIEYDDIDEAVRIANASPYGLSGSVWSPDLDRSVSVARRLRTGTVGINSKRILDFGAPFGGFRASGIGRELGPEGIDSYLESSSILLPDATSH
jgi:acyl-CoA reductase-like NAD-dependent aldehyde dehydrogenase